MYPIPTCMVFICSPNPHLVRFGVFKHSFRQRFRNFYEKQAGSVGICTRQSFAIRLLHYLIYGRDGKLVKHITGWSNLENMKQELDKALGD